MPSRFKPNTLSSAYVQAILDILDDMGFATELSLSHLGVDEAALGDIRRRIRLDDFTSLLDTAGDSLGNETIGLDIGERFRVETFSATGSVLSLSRSLREAANLNGRYQDLVDSCGTSGLVEVDGRPFLYFARRDADYQRHRHHTELVMGGYATTIRYLGWAFGAKPTSVSFTHEAPRSAQSLSRYKDIFGVEPEFGAPANRVGMCPASLDVPLPTASPRRLAELQARLDHALLGKTVEMEAIHVALREMLREGLSTRADLATRLDITQSELSALLSSGKTSFRERLDAVRRDGFDALLSQDIPLSEIALDLGYGDQAALTRACRRWHGVSPTQYRAGLQRDRRQD